MKRTAIFLVVVLLCTLPTAALADPSAAQFGQKQRAIGDSADKDRVLYKIDDDLVITQSNVELERQSEAYNNSENRKIAMQDDELLDEAKQKVLTEAQTRSDQAILSDLIDDLVVLAEAKTLGLEVTNRDAAAYLDANEQAVKAGLQNGTPEERKEAQAVLDRVDAFIAGMGMTKEEYRQKIQIPGVVKLLTIDKMKQRLMQTKGVSRDQLDAAWSKYVQGLREKYPSVS